MQRVICGLMLICLFFQVAFAGKLGGGRSYGMQRSFSYSAVRSPSVTPNNLHQAQRQPSAMTSSNNRWSGLGGALGGFTLGSILGYLIGNHGAQTQVVSDAQHAQITESYNNHSIPWGVVGALCLILLGGIVFFFRKSKQNLYDSHTAHAEQSSAACAAVYATEQADTSYDAHIDSRVFSRTEVEYFLRQANGIFLHIQIKNNENDASEIKKYMTNELFDELHDEIINNKSNMSFSQLECELIDASLEGNSALATVRFHGNVSENSGHQSAFSEFWHFVRTDGKWRVAGIENK